MQALVSVVVVWGFTTQIGNKHSKIHIQANEVRKAKKHAS